MSHVVPRHCKKERPSSQAARAAFSDTTGKRHLDGSDGAPVSCLGHGDADVIGAIKAQLGLVA